jgi:hypothetical protein
MNICRLFAASAPLLACAVAAQAEVTVLSERNDDLDANAGFRFKSVPPPSRNDATTGARFSLISGRRDSNGGELTRLNDGQVPADEDAPGANFFFAAGTDGGRLLVDLGKPLAVKQVNTYSWHGASRGPQVYQLYGSDGQSPGFNREPGAEIDPVTCGWKAVAAVDTRPKRGEGGQYGVSLSDAQGNLGQYQYLLFAVSRTENRDGFGNTFFSEIDVVEAKGPAPDPVPAAAAATGREIVTSADGKYTGIIDTSETPDLTEWAHKQIAPLIRDWYPKLVELLPSQGFSAPEKYLIQFKKDMGGVAATGGTRIACSAKWFRDNLQGEATGAILHEMVHVVQQYGSAPRNPNATRPPGWLVEGITDYIRWYRYEPATKGAEITRRNVAKARYDASYRVTANFLNWLSEKHGQDFVPKLNTAIRESRYSAETWKELAGQPVADLGAAWKAEHEKRLGVTPAPAAESKNTGLTEAEKAAGWKLLFDGKSLDGWHNFKREGIRPGWQVQDGVLVCADPHDAGDIVTVEQFDAFELLLEYNISEGGNSGIMYHVTEQGGAAWATGPEFQLEDNAKAKDPVRCGWLYALYQPPVDPATGKTLDATKLVGEWNQVRLVISPEKCFHEINGVRYFEYTLTSDDFKTRVTKSKFGSMPFFAKTGKGSLALQGDHGQVSFRNIKVRALPAK